jgi:FKBP-type peptidyl-prolyl cis-trans isomerase
MTLRESNRSRRSAAIALLAAAAVAACSDDTPFEVIEDTAFAASLGIDLTMYTRLPSGVYILEETVGAGAGLATGDIAEVDHIGWLSDGTQFSTGVFEFEAGGLAEWEAGDLGVIPGFGIGTLEMQAGGVRRIIIPPSLAYGSNPPTNSSIPVGAILVFEVELISIR